MNKSVYSKYSLAIAILSVGLLYIYLNFRFFHILSEVDSSSVVSEGMITFLSLFAIFVIQNSKSSKKVYSILMIGFSLLFFSLLTDTLDELVEQPNFITLIFEDIMQLAGYVMIVIGLKFWGDENRLLKDELNSLATTDFLTNVRNRHSFSEAFATAMNRRQRYPDELSLIIFDLDNFKKVNDTYGHITGDKVLQHVSHLIAENLRQTDIFARIGGEEFAILAAQTNMTLAKELAERLKSTLEESLVEPVGNITASFGVTSYADGDDMTRMMKRADKALYQAKKTGRNRVVVQNE